MYLIDTSVWVDFFKNQASPAVACFKDILDSKVPFGITSVIYQEILQGARSEQDMQQLISYLNTQRFFHVADKIYSYEAAARIYFLCRSKGVTIRSTIDCLIAQVAIEHNLILVHNDKDYWRISQVFPELKLI